jgi:predicted unusual protein kinase regulating ubiquinone biosynthesis (AarF/ABC1/UbiB family)
VEEVIAQSLRAPGQVFAELQQEPAAAASIAQVHKARLRRESTSHAGRADRTRPAGAALEPDRQPLQDVHTAAVAVTWAGQQRAVGGGASVTLPAPDFASVS